MSNSVIHDAKYVLILLFFLLVSNACLASPVEKPADNKITLKVAILPAAKGLNDTFEQLAKVFTYQNPNIQISYISLNDRDFKVRVSELISNDEPVDILSWHAGERLFKYARAGYLLPVTDIWAQNEKSFITSLESQITNNGATYAIPYSYYQWGMYYKISLFKRLNLKVPQTWSQFIELIEQLKQYNLIPIAIGAEQTWASACWFEYINLRLNGYEFHTQFIKGEISAYDERIKQALEHWKTLIELRAFDPKAHNRDIRESLPLIYQEKAGLTLAGSFIESFAPDQMKTNIGFFEFPKISNKVTPTQVTPVDVFIISRKTQSLQASKLFINFLAQAEPQSQINNHLYQLPTNLKSRIQNSDLLKATAESIIKSKHLTQFYDRQADDNLAVENMRIWNNFLAKPDISSTIEQMEQVRKNYINKQ